MQRDCALPSRRRTASARSPSGAGARTARAAAPSRRRRSGRACPSLSRKSGEPRGAAPHRPRAWRTPPRPRRSPDLPINSRSSAEATTPGRIEVAGRSLERVRLLAEPFRVAGRHRLTNAVDQPVRIRDEQRRHLARQLDVATDPLDERIDVARGRHRCDAALAVERRRGVAAATGRHSRRARGNAVDELQQSRAVDRLRDVVVHADLDAALAIALHRVRGHRDDREVRAGRLLRARGSPWSPRSRPSPASARPSAPDRPRCVSRRRPLPCRSPPP